VRHVFVETNWAVDYAAPEHRRNPAAGALLDKSRRGELKLHLPALCISEAKRTIQTKFQPRGEADAIRLHSRKAVEAGKLSQADRDVVMRAVDMFEKAVWKDLAGVDQALSALRTEPGLEIFAMSDSHLDLSVAISFSVGLGAFDQAVLAAVLGRATDLLSTDKDVELVFCEKDSDLQPWDKDGNRRAVLADLYDPLGIWVYGDFDMEWPVRPKDRT